MRRGRDSEQREAALPERGGIEVAFRKEEEEQSKHRCRTANTEMSGGSGWKGGGGEESPGG